MKYTVDLIIKKSEIQLEDDSGQLLSEADEGNTVSRSYILLQDSGVDIFSTL